MRNPALSLVLALALCSTACGSGDAAKKKSSEESSEEDAPKKKKGAKSDDDAAASASAATSAAPAAPAVGPETVTAFFQGEPTVDVAKWKGWVNNTYDFGFRIPSGWTSAALPGGGFLMHDKEQKAMIMLNWVASSELSLASLQQQAKNAPFSGTDLVEVVPPTFVDVGSKKFLAKGALAKGMINKTPGEIFWMDLAGIQTHEGETGEYHFIVMTGLKEGVSDAARAEAMSAIRAMTPMSGRPYWKR